MATAAVLATTRLVAMSKIVTGSHRGCRILGDFIIGDNKVNVGVSMKDVISCVSMKDVISCWRGETLMVHTSLTDGMLTVGFELGPMND